MIIAFAGNEPPEGWLLCDGAAIPDEDRFNALRAMVGDKVPRIPPTLRDVVSDAEFEKLTNMGKDLTEKFGENFPPMFLGPSSVSKSENISRSVGRGIVQNNTESTTTSHTKHTNKSYGHSENKAISSSGPAGPSIKWIIKI